MKKVITGNHAVSYGAMLSRAQVIAAYPITPQTTIVEHLADFTADGQLDARFINVESEHSAMAASVGASAAGARAFTASSSHGLALMHEMLHVAAGSRLPIVMANVNRALGTNWNLWADQTDSLSQRDTGWLQFYCESNQEALDTVIQAYRISEQVLVPSMICLDAFFISHTAEIVDIPDKALVDSYLPECNLVYRLDPANPCTLYGVTSAEFYYEFRYKLHKAMEDAIRVAREADDEFREMFGRSYGLVEQYRMEDAELVLVTSGTAASTSRLVIDELRERGERVGMLRIRMFRPFPAEEIRNALRGAQRVAVMDRNMSPGQGGIMAQELRSALCNTPDRPPVYGFVVGLGGRDITTDVVHRVIEEALATDIPEDIIWMGVKV